MVTGVDAIKEQIVFYKQDITERLGKQHTDYQYPQYYNVSFEILRDERTKLQSIISLYETDLDRLKMRVKLIAKTMLGRS